jgi:hypothetical protein
VALSREDRRGLARWLFPRIMIPLVVIAVTLGTMLLRIIDNEESHRLDALRREASDLHHRIRQEECVIGPLNDTIRHRVNDRTSAVIPLCTSFEHLPDLEAKLERINQRLAEAGG